MFMELSTLSKSLSIGRLVPERQTYTAVKVTAVAFQTVVLWKGSAIIFRDEFQETSPSKLDSGLTLLGV
eukprot:5047840-Amphidinium_carterae.1